MILFLFTALALGGQPTKRLSDSERGGELYAQNCWMCHGKKGQGNGPAAAAFATESPRLAKQFNAANKEKMIRVILDGKRDMPAFNAIMDRNDAKRILDWLDDPKAVKSKPKDKPKAKPKTNGKAKAKPQKKPKPPKAK